MKRSSIILIIILIGLTLLLQLKSIGDVDIFTQISLGQLQLEQLSLISHEPFSYPHLGKPIPNPGWLAQILFSLIYQVGGWKLLKTIHDILFVSGFILIGAITFKKKTYLDLFSGGLAVALGFLVAASNSYLRPQGIAVACFSVLLVLARSELRLWVKLFLAIPLMVFWQNSHPSLNLGTIALFALILGAFLESSPPSRRQRIVPLLGLLGLSVLLQLATPDFQHIFEVSRQNLTAVRTLKVDEWMPPWNPLVLVPMTFFWLMLGEIIIFVPRFWKHLDHSDLILSGVFLCLSLFAARFALFWALVSIPLWADIIYCLLRGPGLFSWKNVKVVSNKKRVLTGIAGFMVLIALFIFAPTPKYRPGLPIEAVAKTKSLLGSGRIYNYREWGGFLIFSGFPSWTVAIDGRLYLYPKAEWEMYLAAARGEVPVSHLIARYNPDAFFLRKNFHSGLVQLLKAEPNWYNGYEDDLAIVFLKRQCRP